ncbi:MAG: hypothetical protein KGQ37_09460 [Hyphomicrobiales bacterium]|nr:hypothetical protein [Hyphomicrobiales bacterium]
MAYDPTIHTFLRKSTLGTITDAAARPDSVKFEYGYATADVAATVETAGYFDAASQLLNVGDVIVAVMNAGVGLVPVLKSYVVLTNAVATGGHITIGLATTVAG